jgi:hypothetical protein
VITNNGKQQIVQPKSNAMSAAPGAGNLFIETEWRDEDVVAAKKYSEVLRAKGCLQAIVLDHPDEEVWGGIQGVKRTEEWRDGKQKL